MYKDITINGKTVDPEYIESVNVVLDGETDATILTLTIKHPTWINISEMLHTDITSVDTVSIYVSFFNDESQYLIFDNFVLLSIVQYGEDEDSYSHSSFSFQRIQDDGGNK